MQTSVFNRTVELNKLFDQQIATLSRRGCPPCITEKLLFQKTAVVFAAAASKSAPCHIPFIPVIPQRYLTVYSQMDMLRNNGVKGITLLNPSDFNADGDSCEEPYYLFGVKGDVNMVLRTTYIDEAESDIRALIREQRRHCLTIVEAIALALHTDILQTCLVRPLASKYALFLYLRADGVPVLDLSPEGSINDWCVPSYAFQRSYIK